MAIRLLLLLALVVFFAYYILA